ncbi:Glycoside hydrolase [Chitinophaga sp. 180180018-2]|nr:Glycoside hydrolase [Chitinophaga sp. 212800010-3]
MSTGASVLGQQPLENYSASLPATDALGRKLPTYEEAGPLKSDRFVGMFYWTWHAEMARKLKPVNTTAFLQQHPGALANFNDPAWPKKDVQFFWNEPLFGFYSNLDKWVVWKHAEMLADAGVDMIMFDCTNGDLVWKSAYVRLCEVFSDARKNGIRTPQIAFMLPFGATEGSKSAINQLYNDLYKPGLYKDLWFMWKGKPLIMAYEENIDNPDIKNFFTFRPGQPVYNKGPQRNDHWGWLEIYPQHGFAKDANGTFEQMTVGVSQNWTKANGLSAMNAPGSFGRSYTDKHGQDPRPDAHNYGLNFQEQWDHALTQPVQLIFVTGWNEWVAGRYDTWQGQPNAFPDEFDTERSRDIEPMKGGHLDNYYYQLVSNIRRFKGMPAPEKVSPEKSLQIDGQFSDWQDVLPRYTAHKGSTLHRDADGYAGTHYINNTGRNDIIAARVARDKKYVYFYVETAENLTPANSPRWMRLFIDTDRNKKSGWEGYDYVINRVTPGKKAILEKSIRGWNWKKVAEIDYQYTGNQLELRIPRKLLEGKESHLNFEFKWSDNMQQEGDVMDFLVNGDAAPSGRFNYLYKEEE